MTVAPFPVFSAEICCKHAGYNFVRLTFKKKKEHHPLYSRVHLLQDWRSSYITLHSKMNSVNKENKSITFAVSYFKTLLLQNHATISLLTTELFTFVHTWLQVFVDQYAGRGELRRERMYTHNSWSIDVGFSSIQGNLPSLPMTERPFPSMTV